MKEGYYAIRTYVSGQIGEKIKYWVPGEKPTKSERKMKSDIRKQQQNENDAVKRVARLLNGNFVGGDVFATLTFSDESLAILQQGMPDDLDDEQQREYIYNAARHQLQLFLRRYVRACKNADIDWKYVAIVSDMDGQTGDRERVHIHLVAPANTLEIIKAKWTMGKVRDRKVWNEPDHFGLAKYLLDQVLRIPDAKKYIPSRNLKIPVPKDRIAKTDKEVQPPRGAKVIFRSEYKIGRPQYIRYIIPKPRCSAGEPDENIDTGGAA